MGILGPALERSIPALKIEGARTQLLGHYNYRRQLEKRILPGYMRANRW